MKRELSPKDPDDFVIIAMWAKLRLPVEALHCGRWDLIKDQDKFIENIDRHIAGNTPHWLESFRLKL